MEVILGGLGSLLYGVADFLGGEGAKRIPSPGVVLWGGVVAFPLLLVAAVTLGGEMTPPDWGWGLVAGVCGCLGLIILFAGLARGHAAAVAPVSAVLAALVPVAVAVIAGQRPSLLAWFGVTLAIPAILLCAWVAERGDTPFGGLGYGLAAGLGFGGYTSLISNTTEGSYLLPLLPARAMSMAIILVLAAMGVWGIGKVADVPKAIVVGNGVIDVSGNVVIILALHAGSLDRVAVAAAFYPAVTVVMARLVNGEHLRGRQILGLFLTLVSLVLIALG